MDRPSGLCLWTVGKSGGACPSSPCCSPGHVGAWALPLGCSQAPLRAAGPREGSAQGTEPNEGTVRCRCWDPAAPAGWSASCIFLGAWVSRWYSQTTFGFRAKESGLGRVRGGPRAGKGPAQCQFLSLPTQTPGKFQGGCTSGTFSQAGLRPCPGSLQPLHQGSALARAGEEGGGALGSVCQHGGVHELLGFMVRSLDPKVGFHGHLPAPLFLSAWHLAHDRPQTSQRRGVPHFLRVEAVTHPVPVILQRSVSSIGLRPQVRAALQAASWSSLSLLLAWPPPAGHMATC